MSRKRQSRTARQPERQRSEQGQSLVEFALSFMLVMLVLAGVVDLGRAFFALIALRDAAQEGVIYASLNPTDTSGITARVQDTSDSPIDMTTTTVSVTIHDDDDSDGNIHACAGFFDDGSGNFKSNSVEVEVNYDFTFSMPMIQVIFPSNTITLSVPADHTILYPPCP